MGENSTQQNLELRSVSELKGTTFIIPFQQRGYKWTQDNVRILLDDILDFINSDKMMYCLQPLAVVDRGDNKYEVIDGQQRLTTLFLIYKYLFAKNYCTFEYERDIISKESDSKRTDFLRGDIDELNDTSIDFFYISQAYLTVKDWFRETINDATYRRLDDEKRCKCDCGLVKWDYINCIKEHFKTIFDAPKEEKSIQILWYLVDKNKSHSAFRDINSGKIQLTNSDLIKALLLNRTNGLENVQREQIAVQFEQMERQLAEDKFWYMLQSSDVNRQKGQSRMDLLFNLVAKITDEDYQIESRKSFFTFADYDKDHLLEMWKNVRLKYQRLKDMFDDPYAFHYIGYLTYCSKSRRLTTSKIEDLLDWRSENGNTDFVRKLKLEVGKNRQIGNRYSRLEDYYYGDTENLRRIFILHNIETLLQRYEELKNNRGLRFSYEYFPFELLHKQSWNIEHIASHTDNDLTSEQDRRDWLESAKADFPELFNDDDDFDKLVKDDNAFNEQFNKIIGKIRNIVGTAATIEREEDKNAIGNLVLLDEHTNKYFHNALFPRKRRIVIMAGGLRNEADIEQNVESLYVPVCTKQVYLKAYNKKSSVKLFEWTKEDAKAYIADMQEKLKCYFKIKQ